MGSVQSIITIFGCENKNTAVTSSDTGRREKTVSHPAGLPHVAGSKRSRLQFKNNHHLNQTLQMKTVEEKHNCNSCSNKYGKHWHAGHLTYPCPIITDHHFPPLAVHALTRLLKFSIPPAWAGVTLTNEKNEIRAHELSSDGSRQVGRRQVWVGLWKVSTPMGVREEVFTSTGKCLLWGVYTDCVNV